MITGFLNIIQVGMKKIRKRIYALILCLMMAVALVPQTVLAADYTVQGTEAVANIALYSAETDVDGIYDSSEIPDSEDDASAGDEELSDEEIAEEILDNLEEAAEEAAEDPEGESDEEQIKEEGRATVQSATPDDPSQILASGDAILSGGTYYVNNTTTGTITISTADDVIIVGPGVTWDEAYVMDTTKEVTGIHLDYTVAGANLTLRDVWLNNEAAHDTAPLINFKAGENNEQNTLTIEGTVLLEKLGSGQGTYANVHVAKGNNLTINGSGTLYFYKWTGGSGFGGNKNEMNGDLTFALTGKMFAKGSKQGALIGAGTGANSSTEAPGFVKFTSGEYNLISNSRGAAIGGAAGSGGGSTGTTVYVQGNANININCDYSGAAVGGAGYDGGNDSSGGTLYVDGGSLRTYIDYNAAKNTNWKSWQGKKITQGVNDAAITAQRLNSNNEPVYMVAFDTSKLTEANRTGTYTVKFDESETPFYVGGVPSYGFVQEGLDKGEQLQITTTPSNWYLNGETCMYFYITGENHTVNVNGETFQYLWNSETKTFDMISGNAKPVYFFCNQSSLESFKITVSDYNEEIKLYPYTVGEGETAKTGYVGYFDPAVYNATTKKYEGGAYTYTMKADGYYGSTCGFTVNADGTIKYSTTTWTEATQKAYGIYDQIDTTNATFNVDLETFTKSANPGAWDGVTIDISWFTPGQLDYYISTPAQLAGLAAIVNGIYNDEIAYVIDDIDGDGVTETYTVEEFNKLNSTKLKAGCSEGDTTGPRGYNQVTSSAYYYNAYGYDFYIDPCDAYPNGQTQTVHIMANLDMGGYQDSEGNWTGARYMPVGGQYQMYYVKKGIADGYSHLGSSFNGTLDGEGHIVYNIYCDRYSITAYGDSSTIGLIGRLGIQDNDYSTWKTKGNDGGNYPAVNPTVRNVAVAGYIYGRRSVGGIVGKTGHQSKCDLNDGSTGSIIENCVNFAEVHNTDAKGVGGMVGAGWNGGVVRNCANFGYIHSTYSDPTGGIVGYDENTIINCLNVGLVKNFANDARYAEAIGSNNGGSFTLKNNYYLEGSAAAGGFYNVPSGAEAPFEVTMDEIIDAEFAATLSGKGRSWAFPAETDSIYSYLAAVGAEGCPVPRIFTTDTATVTSIQKTSDPVNKLNKETGIYEYTAGQTFDTTGLTVYVNWSDNTKQLLEASDFDVEIDGIAADITSPLTAGTHTIAFKYQTETYTYNVSVTEDYIKSISVSSQPTTKTYNEDAAFSPIGMRILITKANGKTAYAVWNAEKSKFVDSINAETEYDFTLKLYLDTAHETEGSLTALPAGANGRPVTACITNEKAEILTADTSALTIVAKANKPAQDEEGNYLITTADQLDWIAVQVNNKFDQSPKCKLQNDIEVNETYAPIGKSSSYPFMGTFDGQGHKITLNTQSGSGNSGIFGYAKNATIKNLISAGNIIVGTNSAGVVGYADTCTITDCGNMANVSSSLTSYNTTVGGVVGCLKGSSTITGFLLRQRISLKMVLRLLFHILKEQMQVMNLT